MEEVVINTTSNDLYDEKRIKARAIIKDETNKIYLMNMNDSYNLPGGTHEEGEDFDITIRRELKEELGLTNIEPIPFKKFLFYHDNFPDDDGLHFRKRLNIVYTYTLTINSKDIGKSTFTEYEKQYNDKVEKYLTSEIIELLKTRNDNPWKPFTDKEITIILKEYVKDYKEV